ncbi:MAG: hypothetical protein JXA72_02350 [Bacteroidales bacterium]|nr:hypothetical protein [Bacteroidales bacterium]
MEIESILHSKIKPKEKQIMLVDSVVTKKIQVEDFVLFFESASDVDKGTCADVMKHVSKSDPALLVPYIDILIGFINYKAPRVKWGIPEAIGNMAKDFPEQTEKAIPFLLQNIADDAQNTTVIRWCAAYALTEIAKYNAKTRKQLIPLFEKAIPEENNNGVRNLFIKALKLIEKKKYNA